MKKSILVGLSCLSASIATAAVVVPESCLLCQSVQGKEPFLSCLYDCLNSKQEETQKAQVDAEKAGWRLKELTSEMDDSKSRVAMKYSEDTFKYITKTVRPSLFILAEVGTNKRHIFVNFAPAKVLANPFEENVVVRVDKNKAIRMRAETAWDNEALLIGSKELESQLRTGKVLKVRAQPFGGDTQTFTFDLTGSESALDWCLK